MFRKILQTLLISLFLTLSFGVSYSADSNTNSYTTLGVADIGTFNEYKYRITEQYIDLRNRFEVTGKIDPTISGRILTYAETGYKYLPDDLINKNYFNYLKTAIEKGRNYPENSSYFQDISTAIENYLEKTSIQSVRGSIEAYPSSGNAPLTISLRGNVVDPSGTKLENYNYTWWMNVGGKRVVLGNKVAISYVFREEGNYTVFLDVTSNHKNASGYVDVLPFSSRVDIEVKEKVASLILKVNGQNLGNQDEIKFNPDEARYGILFDATSSTPTSGARFTKTEWDFGNGVKRTYDGPPQVERVVYASEGDYTVKLTLKTNELKTVERKFTIRIHQPIATIHSNAEEGYMGDKFTFTASSNSNQANLSYTWRIIDIDNDVEIVGKNSSTFTHTFTQKGKYNVQLFVTEPSGEIDYDSKIIYINSRAPEAKLEYTIPYANKPNTVFLDGSSSFDPDYTDDGKLTFSWEIDGQKVNLSNPNYNGSNGYYTFTSLGDHSVSLEVTDPDNMASIITQKINIRSLLSVDFNAFPRVSQVDRTVRFIADSPRAQYFEWDFGDGIKEGATDETITHVFKRAGIFQVKLRVVDENDIENTFSKNVFIGDAEYPYPFIKLVDNMQNEITYESNQCGGEGAYVVNRIDTYTFSGNESLDVSGEQYGLGYSWRVGNSLYSSQSFQRKFEDLGCTKVKLTVTSDKNGRSASQEVNVKVENMRPVLGSLDIRVQDMESDPVIVTVQAQGSKDPDGVIQSYLWYYYTDLDPEPQDFRSTRTDSTTFVIPKITGNYYFAVVMKDNNEARVNSEDINDSRYFITLTGDNVNTPLVDLKVNNNSVAIGDEIVFTANVENILGQSLNNLATFSWDFDGDGFYDIETNTNSVTYKYKSSGEMYAKVRVKYKGFSNTKTVTINVSNILKPDFDYVSIGNSFIFFDNSLSNGATYEWDMGDGNKVIGKTSFTYTYTDSKASHDVTLKLTEGTKIEQVSKKVVKNMPNFLVSNREEIAVYSNFTIDENNTITLADGVKEVYFYITSNRDDIGYYVADFNINYDSDLNGGNDDDEDNRFQDSYTNGGPIMIELDNSRQQVVRLYLKDTDGNLVASKDITILKSYIEQDIDVNEIVFEGVADAVKVKLERIKQAVSKFPQEHKLKGMMYIQRLQEEWNDDREKTNIIIEFESFVDEINVTGGNELIDLLESLLIEGENDKSEKSIAYTALKNLIPNTIACVGDSLSEIPLGMSCYDLMVEKLDTINGNSNIDENKIVALSILENIAADEVMTVKEKVDFKAILNTFVYGSVANIPDENKEDIHKIEPTEGGSTFVSILVGIIKALAIIFFSVLGIIGLFFVYYKLTNKDESVGFTDFIALKTGGKKINNNVATEVEDILAVSNIGNSNSGDDLIKDEDIVSEDTQSKENDLEEPIKSEKVTNPEVNEKVPDWLKGSFTDDIEEEDSGSDTTHQETNVDNIENDEDLPAVVQEADDASEMPGWLKGSFSEDSEEEQPIEEKSDDSNQNTNEEYNENITEENTSESQETGEIPDWLKGSFSEQVEEEENEKIPEKTSNIDDDIINSEKELELDSIKTNVDEPKLETKEELDEFTKINPDEEEKELEIPDWLKGTLPSNDDENNEEGIIVNNDDQLSNEEVVSKEENVEVPEKVSVSEEKREENIEKKSKRKRNRKKKTNPTVVDTNDTTKEKKVEDNTNNTQENNQDETEASPDTELWDDGMKIPDWLKTDDEK